MAEQRVTFNPARSEDFDLVIAVGDALSEHGLTRATLDGRGRLVVEQERAAAPVAEQREPAKLAAAHAELGAEETRSLLARAAQFDWERRFPSRPGLPDEAIVEWTFRDRRGAAVTVRAWLRDVEKDPAMAPVLAALRKGVDQATSGRLYL